MRPGALGMAVAFGIILPFADKHVALWLPVPRGDIPVLATLVCLLVIFIAPLALLGAVYALKGLSGLNLLGVPLGVLAAACCNYVIVDRALADGFAGKVTLVDACIFGAAAAAYSLFAAVGYSLGLSAKERAESTRKARAHNGASG